MRAISVKGHGGGAREVGSRVQGRRGAAGTRHLPWLCCCNRAAIGAGHTRTGQGNNGAENTENRLHKRYFRQRRTYPEILDLTHKEKVTKAIPKFFTLIEGLLKTEKPPEESPPGLAVTR
jgi:hypothetical protein